MPVELVLGAISLGIEAVDSSITILGILHDFVVDTSRFGDQVASTRTKISYEIARLGSISRYLKKKTRNGRLQVEILAPSSQTAVFGLLQELEVAFAAYIGYVDKHDMQALRKGYLKGDGSLNIFDVDRATVTTQRLEEANMAQNSTELLKHMQWAGFEKRKVLRLLTRVEDWNNRLMNLLLCVLSFESHDNQGPEMEGGTAETRIDDLKVSAGLSLRALIKSQDKSSEDTLSGTMSPSLVLENMDPATRTATLVDTSLPDSTSTKGFRERTVFFETKPFELRRRGTTEPSDTVKRGVQKLGRLLSHPKARDAGFASLHCVGILRLPPPQRAYAFAFELEEDRFPPGKTPTTLLQAIQSKTLERPTLDERFAMARSLVGSVFQLHSVDWLHKSLRSENVIFGWCSSSSYSASSASSLSSTSRERERDDDENKENPNPGSVETQWRQDYSRPFIVGFEFSRDDDRLDRNIYRHPDRQGPPEERFSPLHDIYSLGVVLLEIGLWRLAVGFEEDYADMNGEDVMSSLLEHAKDRLPHYMGVEYTEAVVACISGTVWGGGERGDEDGGGMSDEQRLKLNLSLFRNVLGRIRWTE